MTEDQPVELNHSNKIKELFESDQADRKSHPKDPAGTLEVRRRDEIRLKKAKQIVARGGILDPHELNMLAFIFQHGATAADYKQALNLATQAVEAGLPPQHSLIPQATDRLMIQEQLDIGVPPNELKQRYGTQVRIDDVGNLFRPPLDGTASKKEFKKFGINQ